MMHDRIVVLDSQISILNHGDVTPVATPLPVMTGEMDIVEEPSSGLYHSPPASIGGTDKLTSSNGVIVLNAIPLRCSPAGLVEECPGIRSLLPCLGLFIAPYGSHGLEILHISFHGAEDHGNPNFGNVQLQGLKISGDPNVPAGQLSFCVDITNVIDPAVAIDMDQRPVVTFPLDSLRPQILNIRDRLNNMLLWARGYGQINRNPPIWEPEWVGCSYILYSVPLKNNVRFSIIWDDESAFFLHAIDFVHLPRGNCGFDFS